MNPLTFCVSLSFNVKNIQRLKNIRKIAYGHLVWRLYIQRSSGENIPQHVTQNINTPKARKLLLPVSCSVKCTQARQTHEPWRLLRDILRHNKRGHRRLAHTAQWFATVVTGRAVEKTNTILSLVHCRRKESLSTNPLRRWMEGGVCACVSVCVCVSALAGGLTGGPAVAC